MTFSGEAIRQLGAGSAFARPGTPEAAASAIPLQQPLASGEFLEGLIPQQSRLVRTSSEARHLANIRELGRQAEGALGSQATRGLGLPTVGGDIGSIESQRQAARAQQANVELGIAANVEQAKKPIKFDFSDLKLNI